MHCECDFDFEYTEYPTGRYFRSNPSVLCVIHDICQWCDERPATIKDQGDKLCQQCFDELSKKDVA